MYMYRVYWTSITTRKHRTIDPHIYCSFRCSNICESRSNNFTIYIVISPLFLFLKTKNNMYVTNTLAVISKNDVSIWRRPETEFMPLERTDMRIMSAECRKFNTHQHTAWAAGSTGVYSNKSLSSPGYRQQTGSRSHSGRWRHFPTVRSHRWRCSELAPQAPGMWSLQIHVLSAHVLHLHVKVQGHTHV